MKYILLLLLAGCFHPYEVPNRPNVPCSDQDGGCYIFVNNERFYWDEKYKAWVGHDGHYAAGVYHIGCPNHHQ